MWQAATASPVAQCTQRTPVQHALKISQDHTWPRSRPGSRRLAGPSRGDQCLETSQATRPEASASQIAAHASGHAANTRGFASGHALAGRAHRPASVDAADTSHACRRVPRIQVGSSGLSPAARREQDSGRCRRTRLRDPANGRGRTRLLGCARSHADMGMPGAEPKPLPASHGRVHGGNACRGRGRSS